MKEEELRRLVDKTTKFRLKLEETIDGAEKDRDISENKQEMVKILEEVEKLSNSLQEECDCFETRDGEKIDLTV